MNADVASFVALGGIFAKERDNVYEYGKVVKGANAATFALVPAENEDHGWLVPTFARDRKQAFHEELTTGKACVLKGADPATFRAYGFGFGLYATGVFFEQSRLPKCDPATWEHLGAGYSRSGAHVDRGNRLIAGADAATFSVLAAHIASWARDARRYYARESVSDPFIY